MNVKELPVKLLANAGPSVKRAGFFLKKHLPEILVIGGGASVIGGTVLACKTTLDVAEIVAEPIEETDDEELMRKEAVKKGATIAVKYLPAAGLVGGGVAMLVSAKSIEHRRFTAALGLYSTVSASFNEYRERVIAEGGEEMDKRFLNGAETMTIETLEESENGKKPKKHKTEVTVFTGGENPLHRIFDEYNAPMDWKENLNANLFFLECQERVLNQRLKAEKRIFLSDVYKAIGFDYHEAGQFLGWLADDIEGCGDGYISFGIDTAMVNEEIARALDANEVPEPSIWLTFNCDGEVWDKPLTKKYDI